MRDDNKLNGHFPDMFCKEASMRLAPPPSSKRFGCAIVDARMLS